MAEKVERLVFVITHGPHEELGSVALTIANGALTAGKKVMLFLTSSGVDLVRKGAIDSVEMKPLEPLRELMQSLMERGGRVVACPPCVNARGYSADDFIDGVVIQGASAMFEEIDKGALPLSF